MALFGGKNPKPEEEQLQEDARSDSHVTRWRMNRLLAYGVPYDDAVLLANDRTLDIYRAIKMIEKGCDPMLAVEIVR